MKLNGHCCFFAHETIEQLQQEQYSKTDIRILKELGFNVRITTSFVEVPYNSDLYFSWWASGSIIPFIKAWISRKPIIVIAGGQEAMLTTDSINGKPYGYLAAPWYKKLATRISIRYCTRLLVVSEHMIENAKKLGAKKPLVVHNCIDTDIFNIRKYNREFVIIIFNATEQAVFLKRAEIFIQAIPIILKQFPNQKFLAIGEKGNAYPNIQKLIDFLNIGKSINFIGTIDNSEIPNLLNRSLLYVQISESETFGVAVAEAMACGTPVVISKKGAIPEIVGDCGVYVDNNDPQSVAEGIIGLLLQSDHMRYEIGLKSRQRILENFSYARRRDALRKIITEL